METTLSVVDAHDRDAFDRLAAAFRAWEPMLNLAAERGSTWLYDADGTVYILLLGPACTVAFDRRREQALLPGDLLVLPATLALDVAPAADFLCLRHEGPPPFHFRERFLQSWVFEHVPVPSEVPPGTSRVVLDGVESGHRLRYEVIALDAAPLACAGESIGATLLVGLEGEAVFSDADNGTLGVLRPGTLALLEPGKAAQAKGPARMARLTLPPEPVFEQRLVERISRPGAPLSAEYTPRMRT